MGISIKTSVIDNSVSRHNIGIYILTSPGVSIIGLRSCMDVVEAFMDLKLSETFAHKGKQTGRKGQYYYKEGMLKKLCQVRSKSDKVLSV